MRIRNHLDKLRTLIKIAALLFLIGAFAASPISSKEHLSDSRTAPCSDKPDLLCDDGSSLMGLQWSGNGSACNNFGSW